MSTPSLPYLGGKSPAGTGVGRWIASLLPPPGGKVKGYVEPFCGMAGVMCHRGPSSREWLNDKDRLIYNWWRVVRDHRDEFIDLLTFTPYSQEQYLDSHSKLHTETDPIMQAVHVTVVLHQGRGRTLGEHSPVWARSGAEISSRSSIIADRIHPLWQRIKNCHLYNEDALQFIERSVEYPFMVCYCDPPYRTSINSNRYQDNESESQEFIWGITDVLKRHKGYVAISGYGDEWDHLGWVRREFVSKSTMPETDYPERVDVLWLNYEPPNETMALFGDGDL